MTRLGVLILNTPAADADLVEQATVAAEWLARAANGDDPEAMTHLAGLHRAGLGTPYDLSRSVTLLTRAAELGYPPAMTSLGQGHLYGQWGLPQDSTLAVSLFRRAATAGNAEAMASMGLCYQLGAGVEQDFVEAIGWLERAVDGGNINAMAMLELGQIYGQGIGVAVDRQQAIGWYQQAARLGNAKAQEFLAAQGIDW